MYSSYNFQLKADLGLDPYHSIGLDLGFLFYSRSLSVYNLHVFTNWPNL